MTQKLALTIGALAVVLVGSLAGFLMSKSSGVAGISSQMVDTETEVGSTDTKIFRDTAKGKLEAGGLNGEGTHKLLRDGGPSQTVYLLSSVVDLEEFVGKEVEVWGETVKAQRASWLMDVGRVKIVE